MRQVFRYFSQLAAIHEVPLKEPAISEDRVRREIRKARKVGHRYKLVFSLSAHLSEVRRHFLSSLPSTK